MPDNPLFELDSALQRAARLVLAKNKAVTTLLEWELEISRQEAALLMQALEKAGIIGAPNSLGAQHVLVSSEAELEQLLATPHAAKKNRDAPDTRADDFSVREMLAHSHPVATTDSRQARANEERPPIVFIVPPTRDPLYGEAVQLVVAAGKVSPTLLRQQLRVGDPRARRILAQLEFAQVISPAATTGIRQVLMTPAALAPYLSQLLPLAAAEANPVRSQVDSPAGSSEPAVTPSALPTPVPPIPTLVASSTHSQSAHSKSQADQRLPNPATEQPVVAQPEPNIRMGFVLLGLGLVLILGVAWGGYRIVKSLFTSQPASMAVVAVSAHPSTTTSATATEPVRQRASVPIAEDTLTAVTVVQDSAAQVLATQPAAQQDTVATSLPSRPVPSRTRVEMVRRPVVKPMAASVTASPVARSGGDGPQPSQLSAVVAAAPEPGDSPAKQKVRQVLAALYADLQAPPFAAEDYFAPQVRRYKNLTNTTPAAIQVYLQEGHFSEHRDAVLQVEPGSLRVSEPVRDGSRHLQYIEMSRAYLVHGRRYQRTRTSIRATLDAQFHLILLKPEQLLEETLE
jgi:Ftsk gamma domain